MRLHFGEWRYDSGTRELHRGEQAVRLSPKAFELLGVLLAARPEVLSKAALHDRLWPKTFVSEATLAGLIKELRAVLEDDARAPKFVRTAHGFGYAFCGEAVDAARAPAPSQDRCYRLIWDDREIALREGENVLGRTQDAVAWISSPSVSRRHARILVAADGGATLEDLGSKNGTRLQGAKIAEASSLASGDEIQLGSVRMTFHVFDANVTKSTDLD